MLCAEKDSNVRPPGTADAKMTSLYKHRRTLLTKTNYLTERQKQRLEMLWATDDYYVALEVTWLLYQDMTPAGQMRVFGTDVLGTRYRLVPGSWDWAGSTVSAQLLSETAALDKKNVPQAQT